MSKLAQVNSGLKYNLYGVDLYLKSVEIDSDVAELLSGVEGRTKIEEIEIVKKLIRRMLNEAVPDATEEEISNCFRLRTLLPLIDAFYEVNGLNDPENLSKAEKIKDAIRRRQEAKTK